MPTPSAMPSWPCTRSAGRLPDGASGRAVTDAADSIRAEAIADENLRMRRLRLIANLTTAELMQSELTLAEAQAVIERMRRATLALFPGTEATFELIYGSRFERIIRGRFGAHSRAGVQ